MVAAALVSDLVTLTAHLQENPVPTVVLIDEFSALVITPGRGQRPVIAQIHHPAEAHR